MVLDRLDNAPLYRSLSPRIAKALEALATGNYHAKPDGRYEIDGPRVYALVQRYNTKPHEQGKWESHRKFIDVQFMAEGVETIGIAPLTQMTVVEAYNPEKDVQFLSGHGDFVTVSTGMFAIFFPEDAHMPTLQADGPMAVVKVVVKIAVD